MAQEKKQQTFIRLLIDLGIPLLCTVIAAYISFLIKLEALPYIFLTVCAFFIPLLIIDMIRRAHFELSEKVKEEIGDIIMDKLSSNVIKRDHFIEKSLPYADKVLSELISHFAEDCYNRCSNYSDKCKGCKRFMQECNGLLRNYLYETCMTLAEAIDESKHGEYKLKTNIEKFHTIAIDHLMGTNSKYYSVIHWIGDSIPNEETYDKFDYHFLNALIQKITEIKVPKDRLPYYKKVNFKIRWLLIGDECKIENNYDYIFYVIKSLPGTEKIINDFFEFYVISTDNYKSQTSAGLATLSDFGKHLFKPEENPSFGIFGDYFLFADADDSDEHGTIYTKINKTGGITSVDEAYNFFNKILLNAEKKTYGDLIQFYNNDLSVEHKTQTLKLRWHKK